MHKTTVLIVEDHQLLRQTWSYILKTNLHYDVVGECSDADEAIPMAAKLRPHIIILDINLPGTSGIEAVPKLLKVSPSSKVLGVSMHKEPVYASRMMRDGAMGYVCKSSSTKEMFTALQEIEAGRKYVCQEIKDELTRQMISDEEPSDLASLSRRELDIIRLLKQGYSSKEMAKELFISVKTVEVHRYHILKKLKLKNAAALVNFINRSNFGDL